MWAVPLLPFSYYPGIAEEGADFGGESDEVVEAAVVAVGGDTDDGTHQKKEFGLELLS